MLSDGVELIAHERHSQKQKFSTLHDDQHMDGTLAVVAAILAVTGTDAVVDDDLGGRIDRDDCCTDSWGLVRKHPDRIEQLVIAGALIAAEIDREQRLRKLKAQEPA